MSGLPLMRAFSTTAWQTLLFETEFGRVWQLRLGLITMAFVLAALGFAQDRLRRALTLALFWLVLFCSSRSPGSATLRLPECNRSVC